MVRSVEADASAAEPEAPSIITTTTTAAEAAPAPVEEPVSTTTAAEPSSSSSITYTPEEVDSLVAAALSEVSSNLQADIDTQVHNKLERVFSAIHANNYTQNDCLGYFCHSITNTMVMNRDFSGALQDSLANVDRFLVSWEG